MVLYVDFILCPGVPQLNSYGHHITKMAIIFISRDNSLAVMPPIQVLKIGMRLFKGLNVHILISRYIRHRK